MVKRKYLKRGFDIQYWHTNNEFNHNKVIETIEMEKLETYACEEHVGLIERSINEIKERSRATCQVMQYKLCPKIMIR